MSEGDKLESADIILTEPDIKLCLGSGELLPCPFCGKDAMSHGEKTPNGRAVCWKISCLGSEGLIPNCCASVWATDQDQNKARADAVKRWNRRTNVTPSTASASLRESICHEQLADGIRADMRNGERDTNGNQIKDGGI